MFSYWGQIYVSTRRKLGIFYNCTKIRLSSKGKNIVTVWNEVVYSCSNTQATILRDQYTCVPALCPCFMPYSALDPVELFASLTFLKDPSVECFHAKKKKKKFGYFVVVVRSWNKENKSRIFFFILFFCEKCLLNTSDSFSQIGIDFPLEAHEGGEGRF